MNERILGQSARVSREQAQNLTLYPELLARLIDMLQQQLDARVAELSGNPSEYIDVMVLAEMRVLLPEEES